MAESDPIKGTDIVEKGALNDAIAQAENYLFLLGKIQEGLRGQSKQAADAVKKPFKSDSESIKAHTDAVLKATQADRGLTETQKLQIETQQKLTAAKAAHRQVLKDDIALSTAAKDSITALAIELREVTKEWNNLSQAEAGDQTNQITKRKKELTETLNKLRKATGDHRMEIGNYSKATQGLIGLLHVAGEALGFNTEALEALKISHMALRSVTKDLYHVMEVAEKTIVGNTVATEANTIATEAQTVANEEEGASWVLALGPLGLFAAAIGALALGIWAYVSATERAKQEERDRSHAVDGSIITDKKLRDEYNETLKTMNSVSNAYKVLNGSLTQYEASINNVKYANSIAMQEIANETTEKLQDATGWWVTLANTAKDAFTFSTFGSHGMEDISKVMKVNSQKVSIQKAKEAAEIAEKIELEARQEIEKLVKASNQRLEDLHNQFNKNEEAKEIESINIKRKYREEEIAREGKDLTGEARSKLLEEAENEIKLIRNKYHEQRLQAIYEYNIKVAQYSKDRVAIEDAEYDRQLHDLRESLIKMGISRGQSRKEELLLSHEHQEKLRQIELEKQSKKFDIQSQSDALIKNNFERQESLAQDALNKELFSLKRNLDDKLISIEQYNKEVENSERKHQQALENISLERSLKDLNSKSVAAGLKTTADTIKNAKPSVIQADEVSAENARYKEEFTKLMNNANTTYQEMEDAYQDHENKLNEINKNAIEKRVDAMKHQEDMILDALSQSLTAQNKSQQDALKTDTQAIQSEIEIQTALASAGKKNSLDSAIAAEKKAQQEQKDLSRKQAREQESIALAKLFIDAESAYLKAGSNPLSAAAQALGSVALAKGIATGISGSFFDGTADTGGPGGVDGRGGKYAILHPHEAVIPEARNKEMPGLAQAWIDGDIENYMAGIYFPKISLREDFSRDTQISEAMASKIVDGITDAIMNQPETVTYKLGNKTIIEKSKSGMKTTRIIDDSPIIGRVN